MRTYVLGLVAISLLSWLAFLLFGRLACWRSAGALSRLRVLVFCTFATGLVAGYVLWAPSVDAVEPLAAAVGLEGGVWVLAQVPAAIGGIVVATAAYLGLFPYVRAVRDLDMEWSSAARRFGRYLIGLTAIVGVFVDGYVIMRGTLPIWAAAPVALVGFLGIGYVTAPWMMAKMQTLREPDPDLLAAIREHCDAVGLDVDHVHVLETPDESVAQALVRGPPGRRHLYLSDATVTYYDADELRARLAHVAAMRDRRWTALRLGTVILVAAVGAYGLITYEMSTLLASLAAMGILYVTLAALLRRRVFEADQRVADRVGADALAAALRRHAAINDAELSAGPLRRWLRTSPSLGRRLRALREREDHPSDDAEFPTPDELPPIGENPPADGVPGSETAAADSRPGRSRSSEGGAAPDRTD